MMRLTFLYYIYTQTSTKLTLHGIGAYITIIIIILYYDVTFLEAQ